MTRNSYSVVRFKSWGSTIEGLKLCFVCWITLILKFALILLPENIFSRGIGECFFLFLFLSAIGTLNIVYWIGLFSTGTGVALIFFMTLFWASSLSTSSEMTRISSCYSLAFCSYVAVDLALAPLTTPFITEITSVLCGMTKFFLLGGWGWLPALVPVSSSVAASLSRVSLTIAFALVFVLFKVLGCSVKVWQTGWEPSPPRIWSPDLFLSLDRAFSRETSRGLSRSRLVEVTQGDI